MMDMPNRIKMEDCKHGYAYHLISRNLRVGFYDANHKAFIGVRTKFGNKFLEREYHWDTGAPHGTANPMEEIGPFPFDEAMRTGLFAAALSMEEQHAKPQERWR